MINIAILDDEKHWREYISMLVREYVDKKNIRANVKIYKNIPKDLSNLDIALLDIDLEGGASGLEVARLLREYNREIIIVFITSHDEYTLESYKKDIDGFGYLLKPIERSELYDKLTQAFIYINGLSISKARYIKIGKENVSERNIISIEIRQRKLIAYTTNGVQEGSYVPLSKLQEELSQAFVLINRSVIINIRYISSYNKGGVWLKDNRIYDLPSKRSGKIISQIMSFQELNRK